MIDWVQNGFALAIGIIAGAVVVWLFFRLASAAVLKSLELHNKGKGKGNGESKQKETR